MGSTPSINKPALAGLFFALAFTALQGQSLPEWARGEWTVRSSNGDFRGEKVRLERDSFVLFFNASGDADNPFRIEPTTCPEPLYETDWEDAEAFFITNRQTFGQLTGDVTTDSIPVLRIYCISPRTGANVYFVKKNKLLLTYLGMTAVLKPRRKGCFFKKN
jgi:hypothetical protein